MRFNTIGVSDGAARIPNPHARPRGPLGPWTTCVCEGTASARGSRCTRARARAPPAGISNGTDGMAYSLQSRDVIADSIETIMGAQFYDGNIALPGCDKNMPGCLMARVVPSRPVSPPPSRAPRTTACQAIIGARPGAPCEALTRRARRGRQAMARHNRPSIMVYGGTIRAGCGPRGNPVDIISAFQARLPRIARCRSSLPQHTRHGYQLKSQIPP